MTIPTSFCGRSVLTLKCEFLSIIWLFPSFYLWLLWLDASKYLTQCWNMCVLPWFLLLPWLLRQLVRLVGTVIKLWGLTDSYDWSLVVLLCWFWNIKKFLISCSDLYISATVTIGCDGRNLLSLGHFLLSCRMCYVRFRCQTVGVCQPLHGECTEPYRQLVRLVSVVVPLLFCFCM